MREIVLSPHLDDAALSLGGYIFDRARADVQIEIWTVMAGFPPTDEVSEFAAHMHQRWGTASAHRTVEIRRREDLKAAAVLGSKPVHFNFLDAIYRRDENGAPLYGDPVGARLHLSDAALPAAICQALAEALLPDDSILCPLGIGDHVDHVNVRLAAEGTGRSVGYFADFPYIMEHGNRVVSKAGGLVPFSSSISDAGVAAWIRAVNCYRSQLGAVFDGQDSAQAIKHYLSAFQGLPMWSAPARPQMSLEGS